VQVEDNPALLTLMLNDLRSAPEQYRPTNYWQVHERRFLPELRRLGLRDFRRRRNSVLGSFGATDLEPLQLDFFYSLLFNNPVTRLLPFQERLLHGLNALANARPLSQRTLRHLRRIAPVRTFPYYEVSPEDLRQMSYDSVRREGERVGARPIAELEASLAGNPADVFTVEGRSYTMATLFYYLHYVYCSQFVDFESVRTYAELGSGMGKQVEVLRKLHPRMCFLLFDIPPQLYVCERYLSTVFPGDVVSFEQTRTWTEPPDPVPGRIFMFGSWKFPILERAKVDLFWNAASFQEMEPDVVANYLRYVNQSAAAVFLHEFMEGKEIAVRKGRSGVLQQTTLEHYRRGLSNFELADLAPSRNPAGHPLPLHSDSFWRRRPMAENRVIP
jgi:putative sugar O-methyltransferase